MIDRALEPSSPSLMIARRVDGRVRLHARHRSQYRARLKPDQPAITAGEVPQVPSTPPEPSANCLAGLPHRPVARYEQVLQAGAVPGRKPFQTDHEVVLLALLGRVSKEPAAHQFG